MTSANDTFVLGSVHLIGLKKYAFFRRLLVTDAQLLNKAIEQVIHEIQQMMQQDNVAQVMEYYPNILRLSMEAPFPAIQEAFHVLKNELLQKWPHHMEDQESLPRVSYFIENNELKKLDLQDLDMNAVIQNAFLKTGRVSHLYKLLAYHPSYIKSLQSSLESTMIRDGSLPIPWRYYIALMASAEFRCHYLAQLQKFHFIVSGGRDEWIRGIDYVPDKLYRLHVLMSLLAHRPYMVTPQHISELLSAEIKDSWSVTELVHAIIVFSIYNSMSCIALGLGCVEEDDVTILNESGPDFVLDPAEHNARRQSNSTCSSMDISELDIASMERDEILLAERIQNGIQDSDVQDQEEENYDAVVDDILDDDTNEEMNDEDYKSIRRRSDSLWRFCKSAVYQYSDFDVRSKEYRVLHTEDFSWDEHCFSLVRSYFPGDAGQILEDMFNRTRKLTYNYFGGNVEKDMDTSLYRMAIWYYVHRIFGICHDDYDYRQINYYLNRPTKFFIKKIACTPWKVSKRDFEHFDHAFDVSEKIHMTLIVAEARKQASLMYGLRAVMAHMR